MRGYVSLCCARPATRLDPYTDVCTGCHHVCTITLDAMLVKRSELAALVDVTGRTPLADTVRAFTKLSAAVRREYA